jgi:hypothetical protein
MIYCIPASGDGLSDNAFFIVLQACSPFIAPSTVISYPAGVISDSSIGTGYSLLNPGVVVGVDVAVGVGGDIDVAVGDGNGFAVVVVTVAGEVHPTAVAAKIITTNSNKFNRR